MIITLSKDQAKKDRQRFGGNTLAVYKRDNYQCVKCGMTMREHIEKYGKRLTINHKNGVGRKSKVPDNRMINLETLCFPCHGLADCQNKKWIESKGNPLNRKSAILEL